MVGVLDRSKKFNKFFNSPIDQFSNLPIKQFTNLPIGRFTNYQRYVEKSTCLPVGQSTSQNSR